MRDVVEAIVLLVLSPPPNSEFKSYCSLKRNPQRRIWMSSWKRRRRSSFHLSRGVFLLLWLLPLVVALRSISAPFHHHRHSKCKTLSSLAHSTCRTASLKNNLDDSNDVAIHDGVSLNMMSYAKDTSPLNGAVDVSVSQQPEQPRYHPIAVPRHVAFVCDGNTRWATGRNLPASMGHAAGANRTLEMIRYLQSYDASPSSPSHPTRITHATFYAFSSENWNRPRAEILDIFQVIERTARHWCRTLDKEGEDTGANSRHIIFKTIGNLHDVRIPKSLRDSLSQLEERTQEIATRANHSNWDAYHQRNSSSTTSLPPSFLTICVAINYGGRQDIVTASKRLLQKLIREKRDTATTDDRTISEDDLEEWINESSFSMCLDTATMPDPDLFIRTSGESRLSNFLLWNLAYTELYFTEALWPDFDGAALEKALQWYAQRQRRFGKH